LRDGGGEHRDEQDAVQLTARSTDWSSGSGTRCDRRGEGIHGVFRFGLMF